MEGGLEGWGCFNNTLQGARNGVGGGGGGGGEGVLHLLCSLDKSPVPFRVEKGVGRGKSCSCLKEGDISCF